MDRPALSLALLPPLPTDLSLGTLRTAYGPGLEKILYQSAASAASSCSCLDIAIICKEEELLTIVPRGCIYAHFQLALSQLYSLSCAISALNPEWDLERRLDHRVFFVREQLGHSDSELPSQGPIVSLGALASARRDWTDVFSLDGEGGESILQKFSAIRKALPQSRRSSLFNVHRVMGGTRLRLASEGPSTSGSASRKEHFSVAVGGTFDHLHAGHKLLLTATALVLEPWKESVGDQERTLIVGITGDELLKNKKYAEILESWAQRQEAVIGFLGALLDLNTPPDSFQHQRFAGDSLNADAVHYRFDGNLTVKCVEISDPFGPTITDERISALVVSGETRSGGKAVNDKRVEKGWAPLEVFEVSVLDESPKYDLGIANTEDFQSKISSTAIRKRLLEQGAS